MKNPLQYSFLLCPRQNTPLENSTQQSKTMSRDKKHVIPDGDRENNSLGFYFIGKCECRGVNDKYSISNLADPLRSRLV